MAMRFNQFKVVSFDCYGTLIDWESGIWDALQPLIAANARTDVTRKVALAQFAELESVQESETPERIYPAVLSSVHRRLAAQLEIRTSPSLDDAFGESVAHWPAFPDSAQALRSLKQHFRLVILSNVHREGFAASNRKLGVDFDAVYTAEEIGAYKPDPRNFEFLISRLAKDFGLSTTDILHTAQSLFHDHEPAKKLGLANVWVDRQRLSEGGDWGATRTLSERPQTDAIFFSMGEMASAVQAEIDEP